MAEIPDDDSTLEIRIAAVLSGGVSLAIWVSGVCVELHHLVLASRGRGEPWAPYRRLLDLLDATAHVDVIAGTSAGGINGAFLALGMARERDLGPLRDLWLENGSLESLLRTPLAKDPPSLLKGDDYFLPKVRAALQNVIGPKGELPLMPDVPGRSHRGMTPVELVLTGTLWQGRSSSFTDDVGTGITELDHDATFRFTNSDETPEPHGQWFGELLDGSVLDQLAVACRCTSSFPAAFEPHWVQVESAEPGADGRWSSQGGRANFRESQYLLDGGILLNKPIRPALEAIYRQPADTQVRRLLAYVVPVPGEQAHDQQPAEQRGPIPKATEVVLGVLTRLMSTDSVSRELDEIRTRNENAHSRRRARDRLATAMTDVAVPLAEHAWPGYLEVRVDLAARTVSHLIAAGQRDTSRRWSEREIVDAVRTRSLSFVPSGQLQDAIARTGADWDWGQTTVQRLAEMAIDVLKRAVVLASIGSDERRAVIGCRRDVYGTVAQIRADRRLLDMYWLRVGAGDPQTGVPKMPPREGRANAAALTVSELREWLDIALAGWEQVREPSQAGTSNRKAFLYQQALDLAGHLRRRSEAINAITERPDIAMDPDGVESSRLKALHAALLEGAASDQEVLTRMLLLDVVQLSFAGAARDVEQEVELVQVSALDESRLTGVQLHHFGAFYRGSWRINDWLQGRMNGASQTVRFLLSPQRLRQLGWLVGPELTDEQRQVAVDEQADRLLNMVHAIATTPVTPDDSDWLGQEWLRHATSCREELSGVISGDAATPTLDNCAAAIVRPLHLQILRDEIPALASAVRAEVDRSDASNAWLQGYDAVRTWNANDYWERWMESGLIGRQRIVDDVGSDTFARTASHAATVTANAFGSTVSIRFVSAVLAGFRGYALMVWAMVTFLSRRSHFGTHVVELALAVGGVLLALTVLVPGVPLGLTLTGVVLLLAGLTVAALTSKGGIGVAVRLLVAAAVVLIALVALLWWDWAQHGSAGFAWTLLIKLGVGVLIVLLGWFVATAQHRERSD